MKDLGGSRSSGWEEVEGLERGVLEKKGSASRASGSFIEETVGN